MPEQAKRLSIERGGCFLTVEREGKKIKFHVHAMIFYGDVWWNVDSDQNDPIRKRLVTNTEEALGLREQRIGVPREVDIPDKELSILEWSVNIATIPKTANLGTRSLTLPFWIQVVWRNIASDHSFHQRNEANIFVTKEEVEILLEILN